MKTVPERLRDLADVFEEKNKEYGDTYRNLDKMFEGFDWYQRATRLPTGTFVTANRLAVFSLMCVKLQRYANSLHNGGHPDSLVDLAVYCMMMAELDERERRSADELDEATLRIMDE